MIKYWIAYNENEENPHYGEYNSETQVVSTAKGNFKEYEDRGEWESELKEKYNIETDEEE